MNRAGQCVAAMKQLQDLGIPLEYPPLKELTKRFNDYIRTGEPWAGKIKFEAYGRYADVILPRREDREISVVLKILR
jgi:hypothetical protein